MVYPTRPPPPPTDTSPSPTHPNVLFVLTINEHYQRECTGKISKAFKSFITDAFEVRIYHPFLHLS